VWVGGGGGTEHPWGRGEPHSGSHSPWCTWLPRSGGFVAPLPPLGACQLLRSGLSPTPSQQAAIWQIWISIGASCIAAHFACIKPQQAATASSHSKQPQQAATASRPHQADHIKQATSSRPQQADHTNQSMVPITPHQAVSHSKQTTSCRSPSKQPQQADSHIGGVASHSWLCFCSFRRVTRPIA
jgi:hypothetical protein